MRLKESSVTNFGLLIAYVLPGLTVLWGLGHVSETVRVWLGSAPQDSPTVGGFLYVTLASIGAGLTISTVRWLLIDTLHHRTGIDCPQFDFSRFQERVAGYDLLTEIHYRYYQFYGNMLIALLLVYPIARFSGAFRTGWWDVATGVVALVFYLGSRDTMAKYYSRVARLLGTEGGRRPPEQHPEAHARPLRWR